MKNEKKYHGVIVPMVTPFTENGKLDLSAGGKIIDHLLAAETFPFVLGTTGESASIPFDMRYRFVEYVAKCTSGRTLVYAGISDTCVENSIKTANMYFDLGIDAFVSHLPAYYPITPDQMLKYYETLAESSPGPVMIYNIVSTTKMSIPLKIIEKLSYHPNIIGMKDSERDFDRMKTVAEMFADRTDFSIFVGWSAQSSNALLYGFDGIVPNAGNIIPGMYKKLYDAAVNSDKEKANEMQQKTDIIASIYQKDKVLSEIFAGLKVMMNEMGLCESWVLPPLTRISPEEENNIISKMSDIGLH